MTDLELARELLRQLLGTNDPTAAEIDNITALLARVRLDEAKWWCHVVNKNKPCDWVALGDERLATLEQAAGGSAAAKGE